MKKVETHKSNIEIFTEAKTQGVEKIEMKTTRERSKDAIEAAKLAIELPSNQRIFNRYNYHNI